MNVDSKRVLNKEIVRYAVKSVALCSTRRSTAEEKLYLHKLFRLLLDFMSMKYQIAVL